ncbi:hypothetical protein BD410DRAFT_781296 [Rickenella mellea]|uniref:Nudix hydrolase domain-containing protein n=1 Tax=Rickenella mellea TaxID=50990 RepID=A0A4Y7QM79_9AGAM|nr:hypothetical protein BD410DRAFT_781296 [Rickenella mellea]
MTGPNVKSAASVVPLLSTALHRIRATPPRIISSPATQPRRAAVALIIRITPSLSNPPPPQAPSLPQPTLTEFFAQDWVNDPDVTAEILFLRREQPDSECVAQNKPRNTADAHVAFPGGRMEEGDEGGLYTAMRQTWEEIGLDLAEKDFMCIGQLDDREITTSLGKRLLMILSPFVFLQVSPIPPPTDPAEGTVLHWIPLASLLASTTSPRRDRHRWSSVTVDVSSRLAPRHSTVLRLIVRMLVGSMQFNAIRLDPLNPTSPLEEKDVGAWGKRPEKTRDLKLWGLSLGMTLDLLAHMNPSSSDFLADYPRDEISAMATNIAPSMTSVFPRFSYPDVNFWIWVFGKRYRQVVRGWEASLRGGGANDKRINWSGTALNTFYAAVRKALIVVIVLRAIGILLAIGIGGWWVFL